MPRQWRRILPWVMVSTLACVGCKKDAPAADDGDFTGGSSRKRAPARLEPLALDELGVQPGLLADGAIFAAVRASTAQEFLRQIPLPSDVTRDISEARRELGFDLLTDDVLARFAIPPDAVVSMTLGRPVGVESRKALAKALRGRDDRFLGNVSRVLQEGEAPPPPVYVEPPPPLPPEGVTPELPAKPIVYAPPEETAKPEVAAEPPAIAEPAPVAPLIAPPIVPPGEIGELPPPPPPPPPIDPAERREIEELIRHGDGMALHFRIHIPSDDPSKLVNELRTRVDPGSLRHGEAACRGVTVELCLGGGREVLVVRRDGKAAVLDMLVFNRRREGTARAEAWRGAIVEAIGARPAELPALAKLAGHASAYLDAPALVELFEHVRTGDALRELEWTTTGAAESLRRNFDEAEQLRRMLDAPRLFDGVIASAHHERDHTQLQLTWPLREDQSALALAALAPPPLVVPVPSLAALCDGSLACARSRGLPSPQEIGTKLGMGIYGDPRQLEDALDAADEAAAAVAFASTWPNALGTLLWHAPLAEARGVGPEAAMIRGLLDSVARIQGAGLSVRRIELGRRSFTGEYALYARVPVNDLGLVSTLLAMAELRMSPTTIDGVEGTISMLRIPEDDVPATLMTREDPTTVENAEGKEVRYGWLTLVDGSERLKWLLDLPTDDGEEPLLYGEIPDLWRLVAVVPDAVDELGFARTWATERTLKGALILDEGQPRLVLDVALHPATPTERTR